MQCDSQSWFVALVFIRLSMQNNSSGCKQPDLLVQCNQNLKNAQTENATKSVGQHLNDKS